MNKKVLIVGGVAGGASTAARLRRMDENAEIIMFERGEYISFANCGLPYHIGGSIEERSALLVQTPEGMGNRFNIDIRTRNEVLSIDRENKKVKVKNHKDNNEYEESYDVLVLSPGSSPLRPPIKGIGSKKIFTLWTIPDTDKIKRIVDEEKPKKAVVVGGGFIGLEMAENLHERGIKVSVVEMADQVMQPVDFEIAQSLHRHIKSKNVNLHLGDGVDNFVEDGNVVKVNLKSGKQIEADMVLLSIGVKPNGELAKEAGLEVNKRGGIIVDEYMKTSDENIYALGDAVEVVDFIGGKKTMIPLAGPANKQGRIVANNICGKNEKYKGTQGTSVAKVFDMTVASTGANEKTLIKSGLKYKKDYDVVITHSKSHAGYYPGAIPMTMKLLFSLKEGKILGAQIAGYVGVDKRIDVLATAIRFNGTIYDLEELELAYAPPYSSAKDPVNMAGFVAENILSKTVDTIQYHEIPKLNKENTIILDVREQIERELGFIENSILIPVNELRNRLNELNKDKEIVIYCAVGIRGYIASRILMQNGFEKVKNLAGGYTTYSCVYCQDEGDMCSGNTCEEDLNFTDEGEVENIEEVVHNKEVYKLNACGLACPGPIAQVFKKMELMKEGDVLEVRATDPGFANDISTWCKRTGNTLITTEKREKEFLAVIQKGKITKEKKAAMDFHNEDKTMVVFSGDLDKAIASFIIANGAAAMGRKVTMFFTFWGLNILRKPEKVDSDKDLIGKMFSKMMPRGSKKLGLSKMNFGGIGSKMIKKVMKDNNVDSLEMLMKQAMESGVRFVACNMSMDLMGITKEEIIDGVEFGGVATYLGAAEESNVNLFI